MTDSLLDDVELSSGVDGEFRSGGHAFREDGPRAGPVPPLMELHLAGDVGAGNADHVVDGQAHRDCSFHRPGPLADRDVPNLYEPSAFGACSIDSLLGQM